MMSTTAVHPKILVLAGRGSRAESIAARLDANAEIHLANSFDEAMAALREGSFDLVISEQGDFMALERSAIDHQATVILDTIGQGVCIIDANGRPVWSCIVP